MSDFSVGFDWLFNARLFLTGVGFLVVLGVVLGVFRVGFVVS